MTPLVLIPGTLCDGRLFDPLLWHLDSRPAQVVIPDRPDAGAMAEAVLASAPPRFVAGGFSLGGFVVLELMRRAPERLAGAILISSNARPDPPENAANRRAQLDLMRRQGARALIDTLWPGYVAGAAQGCAELKGLIIAMAQSVGSDVFAAQTALAIGRPDNRCWLAGCGVPLLVVHGREDRLCPDDRQAELARAPASTLVSIEGAGHFAPLERPAPVAAAIADWLSDLGVD